MDMNVIRGLMRFMRILEVSIAVVLLAAAGAHAQDVTLSVAVSLKGVTEELGRSFMAAHPGVTLRYNFGASGDLQKQIEAGAPIEVFLSAAQRQMDELERQKLIVSATRRAFARNVLTVIKPADSRIDIAKGRPARCAVRAIVTAAPRLFPPGNTPRRACAPGPRDRLEPKLVFAENVRQALDYVRAARWMRFRLHHGRASAPGGEGGLPPARGQLSPDRVPRRRRGGGQAAGARAGLPRPAGQCAGPDRVEPLRLSAAAGRRTLITAGTVP